MMTLTARPEQLLDSTLRLTDLLEQQGVSTQAVKALLRCRAVVDAAEVACQAAKGVHGLQQLRLETAVLAALAQVSGAAPPFSA